MRLVFIGVGPNLKKKKKTACIGSISIKLKFHHKVKMYKYIYWSPSSLKNMAKISFIKYLGKPPHEPAFGVELSPLNS